MNLLAKFTACFAGEAEQEHLRRGKLGEQAAKRYLRKLALKFLTANFNSGRSEMDLVFRDGDCLIKIQQNIEIVCLKIIGTSLIWLFNTGKQGDCEKPGW